MTSQLRRCLAGYGSIVTFPFEFGPICSRCPLIRRLSIYQPVHGPVEDRVSFHVLDSSSLITFTATAVFDRYGEFCHTRLAFSCMVRLTSRVLKYFRSLIQRKSVRQLILEAKNKDKCNIVTLMIHLSNKYWRSQY